MFSGSNSINRATFGGMDLPGNVIRKPGKSRLDVIPELYANEAHIRALTDTKSVLHTTVGDSDDEEYTTLHTRVDHGNVKQLLGHYLIMSDKKKFVNWLQGVTGMGKTQADKIAKYVIQLEKTYLD